jgi:hypothetical protein
MRTRWVLLAVLVGVAAAQAETVTIRPKYARPEDIETIVTRVVPKAGVAAVKAQNSVLVSGDGDVLEEVGRVVRELDQPGQVVELEIGLVGATSSSEDTRGIAGSFKGPHAKVDPQTPASELRGVRGGSSSSAVQSLVAMAGRPAEVTIGDTLLVDGGPLAPPKEVQTGKRIAIDGLRVVEDGKGAEMDVVVDDTVPGALPVVSSGTHAKTSVRLFIGQTQTIAAVSQDSDASASSNELSAPGDKTATAQTRRTRAKKLTAGTVTITLKGIR